MGTALYAHLMVYTGLSLFIIRRANVYLVVCVLTRITLHNPPVVMCIHIVFLTFHDFCFFNKALSREDNRVFMNKRFGKTRVQVPLLHKLVSGSKYSISNCLFKYGEKFALNLTTKSHVIMSNF